MKRIPTKVCNMCGQEKSVHEFGIYKKSLDGFRNRCKECARLTKKPSELDRLKQKVTASSWGKYSL